MVNFLWHVCVLTSARLNNWNAPQSKLALLVDKWVPSRAPCGIGSCIGSSWLVSVSVALFTDTADFRVVVLDNSLKLETNFRCPYNVASLTMLWLWRENFPARPVRDPNIGGEAVAAHWLLVLLLSTLRQNSTNFFLDCWATVTSLPPTLGT